MEGAGKGQLTQGQSQGFVFHAVKRETIGNLIRASSDECFNTSVATVWKIVAKEYRNATPRNTEVIADTGGRESEGI